MSEIHIDVRVAGEYCAYCPELDVECVKLFGDGREVERMWRCSHVDTCWVIASNIAKQVSAKEGTQ